MANSTLTANSLSGTEVNLIRLRRTGLTMTAAAKKLRVSVPFFSRWLRGEKTSRPLTDKFEKLYQRRTQTR